MFELAIQLVELKVAVNKDIDIHERELFSVAYKNVIGPLRASWSVSQYAIHISFEFFWTAFGV